MNTDDQMDGTRTRLDRAATALYGVATQQPQQVGVYLYCTHAVELLRAAGARVTRAAGRRAVDWNVDDHRVADGSLESTLDTETQIRLALSCLADLPLEEFARDPVLAAARAARRALRLVDEPADADPDTNKAGDCRPGSGAGPTSPR